MPTAPPRSALVVRGGWEGHSPVEATDRFLPYLRDAGFDVRVEDSPEVYTDAEQLATTDLILQCYTMGTASDAAVTGLRTAIAAGTGLAGWHGGIADSFRNSADYLHLVGGQFACHPPKEPHELEPDGGAANNFLPYTVNISPGAADHPIVAGLEDFDLVTEQYWVLNDDYLDVLATTTLAARADDPWHRPVTSPAIWTRQWGEGRIFVATPGHSLDVLDHPSVRTVIERGLLWASR
ncbi:ThuA domain-containing protein [uncultured Friedmanniella sp.]|uniref:ThuA domain-containing protein n=1 Tax=uncultured Friedmanniella sp. TaxID=335381 RepID=UPI0035C9E808